MKQQETKVAGIGIAHYPCLTKPDMYQGADQGFKVSLELNEDDLAKFKADCETALFEAQNDRAFVGKRFNPATAIMPYGVLKDGTEVAKFKSASTIKTDDGLIPRKIPLFGCNGDPVPCDVTPGSKIRVAYILQPYWMSQRINGIAARIVAVQVAELAKPGEAKKKSMAAFGFDVIPNGKPIEASEAEAPKNDIDIPWDNGNADDNGGDF